MSTTQTRLLRVSEVMTKNPICVGAATTVAELARLFDSDGISGAPVVDGQNRLIGVVSKTDIIHCALEGPVGSRPGSFFELMAEGMASGTGMAPEDLGVVEEFMSVDPVTATPDDTVPVIARRMGNERIHRVIVVDETNHPIGIVTALDLLSVFPK